jgi:hypothetical protein
MHAEQRIWMANRPDRLSILVDVWGTLGCADRVRLVREIWTDCEFPHHNLDTWRAFWQYAAQFRLQAGVPTPVGEKITLYRGTTTDEPRDRLGLSWTTDRKRAAWFARRFQAVPGYGEPVVYAAVSDDYNALGPFGERGESEHIVLRPERLLAVRAETP